MCGIVGYIGHKDAIGFVMKGLEALEYRGYDSAGIAMIGADGPGLVKQVGRVENLRAQLATIDTAGRYTAIGHTRWATHGAPSVDNAHPHFNATQSIFVVHNGIIENYQDLRAMLIEENFMFASETDTEVIPHLIDFHLKSQKTFRAAFEMAIKDLRGAYAIAALYTDEPHTVYVARLSSPLVIGVGDNEHYLASDASALLSKTKKVLYLDDYEIAIITPENVEIHDLKKDMAVIKAAEQLEFNAETADRAGYDDFMLKEINEAPQTVQSAMRGRIKVEGHTVKLGGLDSVSEQLRYIDRIVIVACGTSYYAGLVGEYLIEELAGIPVEVQLASEFKYRNEPFSRSTALLAISQSGETADTIAAIKKVEKYGVLRLGIVNTVGSTVARITDAGVYCHAGPEQSVASTKAFIAQVTVLTEIALHLSQGRTPHYKPIIEELAVLPDKLKDLLKTAPAIKRIAEKHYKHTNMLYIGRGLSYPCALEGALKLKEVSYIHAEGYAAGEMKHGPLAMIEPAFPTFAIAPDGPLLEKTLSNIEEIKARNGRIIAIATEGNKSVALHADSIVYIPQTLELLQPILIAVVLQLYAYYTATKKGLNVDRPRNLAKSVTVE